jgi:hypothetical protein
MHGLSMSDNQIGGKRILSLMRSPAKYAAMFERRAKQGNALSSVSGCREFACFFKLVDPASNALPPPLQEDTNFGWML